jgi:hypothetical protein
VSADAAPEQVDETFDVAVAGSRACRLTAYDLPLRLCALDVCLIFPAIDAALEGFAVQAVMDASGSPSDHSEEFSRQRMHDAGVGLFAPTRQCAGGRAISARSFCI